MGIFKIVNCDLIAVVVAASPIARSTLIFGSPSVSWVSCRYLEGSKGGSCRAVMWGCNL